MHPEFFGCAKSRCPPGLLGDLLAIEVKTPAAMPGAEVVYRHGYSIRSFYVYLYGIAIGDWSATCLCLGAHPNQTVRYSKRNSWCGVGRGNFVVTPKTNVKSAKDYSPDTAFERRLTHARLKNYFGPRRKIRRPPKIVICRRHCGAAAQFTELQFAGVRARFSFGTRVKRPAGVKRAAEIIGVRRAVGRAVKTFATTTAAGVVFFRH